MSSFTSVVEACIKDILLQYRASFVEGNVFTFAFLLSCQALRIQMKDFLTLLLIFYCFYFNSLLFVYWLYVFHVNPAPLFRYGTFAWWREEVKKSDVANEEKNHRHT